MKKHLFKFSSGERVEADKNDLYALLEQNRQYLDNYLELSSSMYDDEYVARGNGFCDTKFSESFLDEQVSNYQKRIAEIQSWIDNYCE